MRTLIHLFWLSQLSLLGVVADGTENKLPVVSAPARESVADKATAPAAKSPAAEACEKLFGSRDVVLAQLGALDLMSETDAEHANITSVVITFAPPKNFLRFVPGQGSRSSSGLMIVGPTGPPIVVTSARGTLTILNPERTPDAEVWEGDVRRLRVVANQWAWQGVPPPRRGVGDVSLSDFVATYGAAIEELLLSSKLTQDDVLDALAYRGSFRAENLIFLVKRRGDSFVDTFVHVFDGAAPYNYRPDFDTGPTAALDFAEVGPARTRLYVRRPGLRNVRREFGWATAIGAAARIIEHVEQPEFRDFLQKFPHAIDDLALMERAPTEASLHRATVAPARSELTPIVYLAVLVRSGPGPDASVTPWLFNPERAEWVDSSTLAERSTFVLPDGRRIGAGANGGLRWLGSIDALARLREAVRGR